MSANVSEAARSPSPQPRRRTPAGKPPAPGLVEPAPPVDWLSPEFLKGWGGSLSMHAALLLVLGLWYFAPRMPTARVLDTRIAGSENGVENGLNSQGGLNTPIAFESTPLPIPAVDPSVATISPLDLSDLIPKVARPNLSDKPTGGGGLDNPNPGAGDGDGFGLARFGNGGELVRGVEVKVGDPQFTLIWDTPVDLDLHVVEPGGKEIFWEDPKGKRGGELDVDNVKGFGPENVYWLSEDEQGRKFKGAGPPGDYQWFVVYYGGFGGQPRATNWKVRIKHGGKLTVKTGKFRALNERSQVFSLHVEPEAKGAPPK